eukprot:TRINITY_DN10785_c0_g1_i1.p2 TRINITY_DN10785_c0_g1~~TRINITY_DN10785_c0_g1_i1.p2  ORF type:complete len:212 (+),score=69.85 TRINITY_DN10785_c0_g1_i1:67-702(+)
MSDATPVAAAPAEAKKVEVEDVKEDDDIPALEKIEPTPTTTSTTSTPAPAADAHAAGASEEEKKHKQSKSEKKSRKAVAKLGLKPVPGVVRVTVKKSKNILFVISQPDVHKAPNSDTFVIFGEAKMEDFAGQQLTETAKHFTEKKQDTTAAAPAAAPAAAEADSGPVDESGVSAKDIELVMTQTSASRSQAVAALKETNNDIVNAIMKLTM